LSRLSTLCDSQSNAITPIILFCCKIIQASARIKSHQTECGLRELLKKLRSDRASAFTSQNFWLEPSEMFIWSSLIVQM